MTMMLVFPPAYFYKHNIMLIKLGTKDVKMTMSKRY